MANAINELAALSFDEVRWITSLRNKLCENGSISESDIEFALTELFIQEKYNTAASIPVTDVSPSAVRENILYKLSGNKNVGGLLDDQELIFSPFFSLVFGKNGTGKSTYYKILKDAFHTNQEIKTNIYASTSTPTSANISFTKKNAYKKHQKDGSITDFDTMETFNTWNPGQKISSKIKFCDTHILSEALTKKDAGWDVDKFKLGYFDLLREAVDSIEEKVNEKIKAFAKDLSDDVTIFFSNLKNEDQGGYKSLIKNNTSKQNAILFEELLQLTLPTNFEALKEKYTKESTLKVSDITLQIETVKARISILTVERDKFHNRLRVLRRLDRVVTLVKNYTTLKEKRSYSSFDKYQLLFALTGNTVKDNSFIALIKSITETALKHEYKNYPENINKCFYCNSELTDESNGLIKELHALVNSTLEKEINEAKKNIDDKVKWISEHVLQRPIDSNFTLSQLGEIYSTGTQTLTDINNLIKQVSVDADYNLIKNNLNDLIEDFSAITASADDVELIYCCVHSELSINEALLSELTKNLNSIQKTIDTATKELYKLNDLDFIVKNHVLINRIKANTTDHIKYSDLTFRNYKTKISTDKSRVESSLVRNNYNDVFEKYTQKFNLQKRDKIGRNFSIKDGFTKIEPKITTDQGNFPIHEILSEGEAKIYALCDWLTELEFDSIDTLIFDDPINSLDHRNIEKVTEIIIELCGKYQVVVFTHNFEFYDKLVKKTLGLKAIEQKSCEICKTLPDADKCHGKPSVTHDLRKCGNYFKIEYTTQPGKALKDMDFFRFNYEQRIEDLKNRIIAGNQDGLSGDIRITINNYFENYILADIKREVFRGEDLIHRWSEFKEITDTDYNKLKDIHNKLSGKSIHEPNIESTTELDILDYKTFLNEFITVINNCRGVSTIALLN